MSDKTKSERLFEEFCSNHSIPFERIEPDPSKAGGFADYWIKAGWRKVLVEVKQFDPNSEDKAYSDEIGSGRVPEVREVKTKARIRKKIDRARPQLQQRSHRYQPTILALYSNLPLDGRQIQPHFILEAMYGDERAIIALPDRVKPFIRLKARIFGGERKVSPDFNTTLSAILYLYHDWNTGELCANLYHNIYASAKLSKRFLRGNRIKHFTIDKGPPGTFRDWKSV